MAKGMEMLFGQILKSLPPETLQAINNLGAIAIDAQSTLKLIAAQNAAIMRHLGISQDEITEVQNERTAITKQ